MIWSRSGRWYDPLGAGVAEISSLGSLGSVDCSWRELERGEVHSVQLDDLA